jgi:hypothetical protein
MIFLLLILLLFALVQSILELKKDEQEKYNWDIKKILSLFYLIGFIIGLIVLLLQNKESKKLNDLILNISTSVNKMNSIFETRLKDLSKSVNQTHLLFSKSDSLDKKMTQVIDVKEDLIKQYKNVNEKLSKQLELELKQLMERSPNIGLIDDDIILEGNDSTSYSISVCIRNFGKRTAMIYGGNGCIICFNKKNKPFHYIEIRGNNNKGFLEPNEISKMRLCYYSFGINNLEYLKTESEFSVVCLKVHYEDLTLKKDTTEIFYSGWLPSTGTFGGLKDWQYNAAKKWLKENLNSDFKKQQ